MIKKAGKILLITAAYIFSTQLIHAFDIDATVDDEIRKNYNSTQLIQDTGIKNVALDKNIKNNVIDENLPNLPNITQQQNNKKIIHDISSKTIIYKPYTGGNIKVKSGTTFDVINLSTISDWQRKGTKLTFKTKGNTFGKNYTIPAGTIFNGEIIDSHQPQITCNGGLVVIKIDSMIYKEQKIPILAYVTRANDKKIFFNNIKGKRTYLQTTWKKGNWGRTLFNKMFNVSVGLGGDSSTLILTPFPFAYGTICLGANTIISPISAFFSKGEHISIPQNSNFRIKLMEEVMID